jgi:hypothetical protein
MHDSEVGFCYHGYLLAIRLIRVAESSPAANSVVGPMQLGTT